MLLTRLKQHDHPLSFLCVSIYSQVWHPKEPCRTLYLTDDNPRKDTAVEEWVYSGKRTFFLLFAPDNGVREDMNYGYL